MRLLLLRVSLIVSVTAHGLVFIIYYSKYIAYHLIILHMKKPKHQTDFNLETIYVHFLAEKKKKTDLSFLTMILCTSYHCF